MTVLRTACPAWMPPLLLHLLICFHQSSSVPTTPPLHDFNIKVQHLGDMVKTCPENCSLALNTSQSCQCFDVSASQEECGFPNYFTRGLNALNSNVQDLKSRDVIEDLIFILENFELSFKKSVSFCSSAVTPKASVSPNCLYKKLNVLKELMNSDIYIAAQTSLPTDQCDSAQ